MYETALWMSSCYIPINSGDDTRLYVVAEFPRGGLFRRRQTRSPERHQWILGLQHRHSALGCGGQRPPEDGGRLPEADAAQEEGTWAQEASLHVRIRAEQQRYSVERQRYSVESLFAKPNSTITRFCRRHIGIYKLLFVLLCKHRSIRKDRFLLNWVQTSPFKSTEQKELTEKICFVTFSCFKIR